MKLSEGKAILSMVVLAMLILIVPQLIRYFYSDKALLGEISYYNMRIAKDILGGRDISYDKLVLGEREYVPEVYHYVLAYFSYPFGVELGSRLLPLILGLSSFALFYYFLKKIGFNLELRVIICSLLCFSPAFIYAFTVSNKYALFVFLFLLGLVLTIKNNRFSLIPFIIIPFLGLFETVVSILGLFAFYLIYEKKSSILISIVIIALISLGYYVYFSYSYSPPGKVDFIQKNVLRDFFSNLGAKAGFDTLIVFLALIGLLRSWKKKLRLLSVYIIIVILLLNFYYRDELTNIYLNFILVVFAGLIFYNLIVRKWQVSIIKNLTIIILACGILFSVVSFLNVFIKSAPDKDIIKALEFLENEEQGVVLSHYSIGFFIETIANKKAIVDPSLTRIPNVNQRYVDSNFIFLTRSLKDTRKMLKDYNVTYILIDDKMKSGMVWEKEEQGLLFLFRNSETFKNIYRAEGAEVWKVLDSD